MASKTVSLPAIQPACLALLACGLVAPVTARGVEIPEGVHVLLRMVNSISTRTAQPGDYVYMRTASPITADGRIVVPTGSYVQGVVTHSKRPGKVKGKAQLGIRLETLTLARGTVLKFSPLLESVDSGESGQKVDQEENLVRQAPGHGRDAAQVAIFAGTGAMIGGVRQGGWKQAGIGAGIGTGVGIATVLLTRGREVELRQGTSLDVVLDRAVALR